MEWLLSTVLKQEDDPDEIEVKIGDAIYERVSGCVEETLRELLLTKDVMGSKSWPSGTSLSEYPGGDSRNGTV